MQLRQAIIDDISTSKTFLRVNKTNSCQHTSHYHEISVQPEAEAQRMTDNRPSAPSD